MPKHYGKSKPKKMKQQAAIAIAKKKSSITNKAYANMQAGFPKKNRKTLKIKT